ncbi:DUF4124 domain-containing protein [Chitinibacter sp. SCUT-21]|uniref:DUF4124 domain-containing protein n=1 Tax=Chitinibacter sp. SCUT-21 TaxID=2970891 RepID=UPI0035A71798
MRISTSIIIAAACLSMAAQAEVYKWVDSTGRVVYSDQPPPAGVAKSKKVNVRDTAVTSVATQKRGDASAASAVVPNPAASTPAQAVVNPPRDEAACGAAQKRLSFLLNAKLFKEINEKGSVEFLETDKKRQEIAEKQAFIEKNCK